MSAPRFSMVLNDADPETLKAAFRQALASVKAGDTWGRIMGAGEVMGTWTTDPAYAEQREPKE